MEKRKGFQRYLDDAMTEANESNVSLNQVKDLYPLSADVKICDRLIDVYDKLSRRCYNLAVAWGKFSERRDKPQPYGDRRNEQRNRETKDDAL